MINAWSLAYDVLNGTLDENFPTMTDDKNENDPIFTVGSGNTASSFTTDFCVDTTHLTSYSVDTTQLGEISIDTSNHDTVVDFETLNLTFPDGCHDAHKFSILQGNMER